MKKRNFTIVCVFLICTNSGLISAGEDNLNTYHNENDIPAEPEQLRLFLLKGYNSAKSVINDVRIEYQRTRIPANTPPINISNLPETSTSVCEYIQKNNKERYVNLNVSIGKTTPPENLSYRTELVRTEDSPHFKVFDGQCILDYSSVNDSYTSVGRAILESNKTGFFKSADLLCEYAPVRFFGYWPGLMPDDVLSSSQLQIETKPEIIGELLTYKVSAVLEKGDVFEIFYWLSPERSCLPVKIEVWRNGKLSSRSETKEFIELEDGRWAIKSILQRNYKNWDDRKEPYELVNFLNTIRNIELHPEIDEDVIFDTSPDSLPEGAQIVDNRSVPRLKYINSYASSLMNKPLPDLEEIGINLSQADVDNKMLLICFFNIEQKASRNCMMRLFKRAQEFLPQDLEIIVVQTSMIEQEKLDAWMGKSNIDFTVAMVEADEENIRFNWGVESLPWLILTDKNHVVTAEGFSLN